MVYGHPNKEIYCQQVEGIQYNDWFGITAAIKETSKSKLYN